VPDRRRHRGPHPSDARLFAPAVWPALRSATEDLSWLSSRGYATASALAIVGNRYRLTRRQRDAVSRCAASEAAVAARRRRECRPEELAGRALWIDGYNVLTTVEAALAGAVVLHARDGCYRDVASVHGSYRKVEETLPALDLLGERIAALQPSECRWLFDSPVSNSGRLRTLLLERAERAGWRWEVELVRDPDPLLARAPAVVATSDSAVLDRCAAWLNLARYVVSTGIPGAGIVDLSRSSDPAGGD
jgi:hypothetical protein